MDTFFEILKLTIPALVVFTTAYFLINKFLAKDKHAVIIDLKKESARTTIPLRIQSYERLVLLLERISPEPIMVRAYNKRINANDMKIKLKKIINDEFDHNVAQQIYVSNEAWGMVVNAKNEMISLVNIACEKAGLSASAEQFGKVLFEITSNVPKQPTHKAIDFLKDEVRGLF